MKPIKNQQGEKDIFVNGMVDNITNNLYFKAGFNQGSFSKQKDILKILNEFDFVEFDHYESGYHYDEMIKELKKKIEQNGN